MNLMNNPYVRRSSQLVETHSAIGKNYVPNSSASLNRWIAFSDKVMARLDTLGKKALLWEEDQLRIKEIESELNAIQAVKEETGQVSYRSTRIVELEEELETLYNKYN